MFLCASVRRTDQSEFLVGYGEVVSRSAFDQRDGLEWLCTGTDKRDRLCFPPFCHQLSIAINDGDAYTHSISATLTLAASDAGSGVAEMRLSDDGATWSAWEPYATSKPWTLPAGDGEKTVYVEYRDHAVRTSVAFSDTIVLDTLAPVSSAASPANSLQTYFTVTWSGTDAHSGVASYDVEYRVGSDGEWIPWLSAVADSSAVFGPSAPMVVVRGATYYFQVRARDNVGNLEAYPGGDGDTSTYVEEVVTLYLPMIMQGGAP